MKPKIIDLIKDKELAVQQDQFKFLLNQAPPEQWIKKNPYAKNAEYLPIDKIEHLLDTLFQQWKVEILESKPVFNAIQVTVRVHYLDPVTNTWLFHDGVGASELQTAQGTGILKPDFSNLNKGAIEIAAPKAKSEAIKDAADHLGRLFGRDLNRKNTTTYKMVYQSSDQLRLKEFILKAETIQDLYKLEEHIESEELKEVFNNRKNELNELNNKSK